MPLQQLTTDFQNKLSSPFKQLKHSDSLSQSIDTPINQMFERNEKGI